MVKKQPHLQYLSLDEANAHCAAGASVWGWAGTEDNTPGHEDQPDIILAAAGDVPTLETLAAARLLREHVPLPAGAGGQRRRPDGPAAPCRPPARVQRRQARGPVHQRHRGRVRLPRVPRAAHELLHGRPNPGRFHVRGFIEQGTTTPFDMVLLNRMSRYHLVLQALRRSRRAPRKAPSWSSTATMLDRHHDYVRENLQDMPEVRDWTWTE